MQYLRIKKPEKLRYSMEQSKQTTWENQREKGDIKLYKLYKLSKNFLTLKGTKD